MRKRLAILAAILAAGLAMFAVGWSLLPGHRVTVANVNCLKVGMTQAECEELLGPPGEYDGCEFCSIGSTIFLDPPGAMWVSREAAVVVAFDDDGKIYAITHGMSFDAHPGVLGRLRRWLKL